MVAITDETGEIGRGGINALVIGKEWSKIWQQ